MVENHWSSRPAGALCIFARRCNMTACWSAVNVEVLKTLPGKPTVAQTRQWDWMSFKTYSPSRDVIREEHPAQGLLAVCVWINATAFDEGIMKFLAFRKREAGWMVSIAFIYSYPAGVSQTSQRHHLTPSLCHSQLFSSASSVNKMPDCSQLDTQH